MKTTDLDHRRLKCLKVSYSPEVAHEMDKQESMDEPLYSFFFFTASE